MGVTRTSWCLQLTCSNGVVNVDHVVFPAPRPGVLHGAVEGVVLVHGGDDGSVELECPEHGGASWTALEPDDHGRSLRTLLRWEEPEEHVSTVWLVDSQEAGVALDILTGWKE